MGTEFAAEGATFATGALEALDTGAEAIADAGALSLTLAAGWASDVGTAAFASLATFDVTAPFAAAPAAVEATPAVTAVVSELLAWTAGDGDAAGAKADEAATPGAALAAGDDAADPAEAAAAAPASSIDGTFKTDPSFNRLGS